MEAAMITNWPAWTLSLLWTAATILASWLIGYGAGAALIARVPHWAPVRQRDLARTGAALVGKRLPWWALLVGGWVSLGYWTLTAEGHALMVRSLFVIGTLSITFTAAAIATRVVDAFGALVTPALPVSSVTPLIEVAPVDAVPQSRA
jgi:hypothetical protein